MCCGRCVLGKDKLNFLNDRMEDIMGIYVVRKGLRA